MHRVSQVSNLSGTLKCIQLTFIDAPTSKSLQLVPQVSNLSGHIAMHTYTIYRRERKFQSWATHFNAVRFTRFSSGYFTCPSINCHTTGVFPFACINGRSNLKHAKNKCQVLTPTKSTFSLNPCHRYHPYPSQTHVLNLSGQLGCCVRVNCRCCIYF